jgi:regulator of sigma E protease
MSWINEIGGLAISAAGFIVAIGLLVAVHEFGHFWVARRLGMRVLRFSIGFGRPLWRRTTGKDPVEYVIAAIPLGGYVKLLDEREGNVPPEEAHRAFNRQPVWKRIAVLLAGPVFNLILAILVYWILFTAGVPAPKPLLGDVAPDSIAARAGLREEDLVIAVAGEPVVTWDDAIMSIVDELTSTGDIDMTVRGVSGDERSVRLLTQDDHRSLTEPEQLLSGLGLQPWRPRVLPIVAEVVPERSAAKAGLRPGDQVVSFDREELSDFGQFQRLIESRANRTVPIVVRRDGNLRELSITVASEVIGGKPVGRIGVGAANRPVPGSRDVQEVMTLQQYGAFAALQHATVKTWDMSLFTLRMVGRIVTGNVSPKAMSGPISIAELTGKAARHDWRQYLTIIALISISLGVFNLLPIPVLDGGQIAYQLAELLKGRPVSERAQLFGQQIGIAMLILVMVLVSYNDIARHLSP